MIIGFAIGIPRIKRTSGEDEAKHKNEDATGHAATVRPALDPDIVLKWCRKTESELNVRVHFIGGVRMDAAKTKLVIKQGLQLDELTVHSMNQTSTMHAMLHRIQDVPTATAIDT